jgi:hypothetical protein
MKGWASAAGARGLVAVGDRRLSGALDAAGADVLSPRFACPQGAAQRAAREIPHAYLIASQTARLVGTVSPGGFESFFTELGAPVVPGAPAPPPPGIEAMAAIAPSS